MIKIQSESTRVEIRVIHEDQLLTGIAQIIEAISQSSKEECWNLHSADRELMVHPHNRWANAENSIENDQGLSSGFIVADATGPLAAFVADAAVFH